jgi:NADPH:quinone reductase-like Zn-dependent oxidoreductase
MRAVLCRTYGGPEVVSVEDMPKPEAVPGTLLVRVMASTISAADRRIRSRNVPAGFGLPMRLIFGWSRLKQPILGSELAGVVEAIGPGVTQFQAGDAIIANVGASLGCHAEYRVISEQAAIAKMPQTLSFEEAAALVFGGTTALFYLRDLLMLKPGEHVLINGAGGAVGSAAVQIAKALGATVTAMASETKHNMLLSLGADHFIDRNGASVLGSSKRYDAILDCYGNFSFGHCQQALSEKGRLGLVVAGLPDYLAMPVINLTHAKQVRAGVVRESAEDLRELLGWVAEGQFKPLISAAFPLEQARAAHEAAEAPHKSGNVVLSLAGT